MGRRETAVAVPVPGIWVWWPRLTRQLVFFGPRASRRPSSVV